jgi:hypothetical protein
MYFSYVTHWILLFANPKAADLVCHLPGSRPSSFTAEKAGGGAKWMYLKCVAH